MVHFSFTLEYLYSLFCKTLNTLPPTTPSPLSTPLLFFLQKPISNHLTSLCALIVTFTVIALAVVGRTFRFLNIAFALWLIAASIILKDPSGNALWIAIASGVLLIGLSIRKGKISESYGTFDRYII